MSPAAEIPSSNLMNEVLHAKALRNIAASSALILAAAGCSGPQARTDGAQQGGTTPVSSELTPQHSTSVVTLPPETTTPTTQPPDAIRAIDFANFTYEDNACPNPVTTWPTRLTNGAASQTSGSDTASISLFEAVVYGDVTNDGNEEAVVPLECLTGTTAIYAVQVYGLSGGQPKRLGIVGTNTSDDSLRLKPQSITVKNQEIVVEEPYFGPNDPLCCPTNTATAHYTFNGANIVQAKVEVHLSQVAPATTPEVTGQPGKISVNSIGDIHPGMTAQEITMLGYTASPGCGPLVGISRGDTELSVTYDAAGKIDSITASDSTFSTLSGITPGSSESALKAAYGKNLSFVTMPGNVGPVRVAVFSSPAAQQAGNELVFPIIDGSVKWITLEKASINDLKIC